MNRDFFQVVKQLLYSEMARVQYDGDWSELLGNIIGRDSRTARRYVEQGMDQIPMATIRRIIVRLKEVDIDNELSNIVNNYFHFKN